MRCLSIRQPWAYKIIFGGKDIENRSWKTPYRGPILIHASKTPDKNFGWNPGLMPTSCIIGIIDLVDCVEYSKSRWFQGPYGFVLANPRPFSKPIPAKGKLKLYSVPDELIHEELLKLDMVPKVARKSLKGNSTLGVTCQLHGRFPKNVRRLEGN